MNAKLEVGFFGDLATTGNYIFWSQNTLSCNAHKFMAVPSRRTLAILGNPLIVVRRSKCNQLCYLKTGWCNSQASRPDRLNGDDTVQIHHAK
jgi:hypothetical protein